MIVFKYEHVRNTGNKKQNASCKDNVIMETHHKHVNDNNYLEAIIRGFSTENNIKEGKL